MALLLVAVMVIAALPVKVHAEGFYDTNFAWDSPEEVQNEWPLENADTWTKVNTGIGTAGFSYRNYYYNDLGRIVLEFELSIFPDDTTGWDAGSNHRTFRNQWEQAWFFIDPKLAGKVDNAASFFMMSYPAEPFPANPNSTALSEAAISDNIYKLNVGQVFPNIPENSDYMKSKLYLVLKGGVTRDQLNQDYAVELRYVNATNGQYYEQKGSKGGQVLGSYYGYTDENLPTFDVALNNDDVTLKTVAPFQTASMSNVLPNPVLPPDMMRVAGQSVIYDSINGKLHVYYKVAPNHYLYRTYSNNGLFLSSWIGIRQVMDSRIFDALLEDENGVVGQMKMFDLNGTGLGWNVSTDIRLNEFSYTPVTQDVGTYSYMMVPNGFKTDITDKAIVSAKDTNNIKNVYLHGHTKEADYVRFIYNVDKSRMDALFADANSSTFSIGTSYITDRPTESTQTEYRLTATGDIIVPKGARIVFELPKGSRSVFKAGLANNYERIIGDLQTRRSSTEMNQGVDPRDFGKAYTVAPYYGTEGGFVLNVEAGLKIPAGDTICLNMFDGSSPASVTITVVSGAQRTSYTLSKHRVNENKVYNMPNADVRSGIIINRSANTPHVDEFFTDSRVITGHSKYQNALVSGRTATDDAVFKQVYSSSDIQDFMAKGVLLSGENGGYSFALDIPASLNLKKDMALSFANAATGYFRSVSSTYRAQAKLTFDMNGGAGNPVERIVPVNEKAYGEEGYTANGFQGDNILKINVLGTDYLSDYEGRPITDLASDAYKNRQFYDNPPARAGYTFLGWSTKQADSMNEAAFDALEELADVAGWDEAANYKFTATSPVDQSRTVYAVWERDLYQYNIILHDNNGGADVTHTVEISLADLENGINGELTAYLKKAGNILFDKGFVKEDHYFVGWAEEATVSDEAKVHELYTNASEVQLNAGKLQLQLNEEPKEPVDHTNEWQDIASAIVNDNGIATLHLYAQYKPLLQMTATKTWYGIGAKGAYEKHISDPTNYPAPATDVPHFPNSAVAMVLLRTTEGKTMDPTKYEIVPGFYVKGKDGEAWVWPPQEGHDANGRKYSYLMTEFNAQPGGHTEEAIIEHFNNKRTWASMYITMIGQSDLLSKFTALSLLNEDGTTSSYMAVATSNQPAAFSEQYVNRSVDLEFSLKNFKVDVLPPVIHRIQENHNQVVIDNPKGDSARYLYVSFDGSAPGRLFSKGDTGWVSNTPDLQISLTSEGALSIAASTTGPAISFDGKAGQKVYALFTATNYDDDADDIDKYAWRVIQEYADLPLLEDVRQEPHIKDAYGNITHNVISARIPAGSYAGADYTLGYMDGGNFTALKSGGKEISLKPDDTEKLSFKVPSGILQEGTNYIIRGKDPAKAFKDMYFAGPVIDLTAPAVNAASFTLISGDPIGAGDGQVTIAGDPDATLRYKVTKGGVTVSLPDGISFDPVTQKLSGQTPDVLAEGQAGEYAISFTAEDAYGNASTKDITLTLNQKPTTAAITSITQKPNAADGSASISVEGINGAVIKLYSRSEDGTFTEIEIAGISGSPITNADGTININISQADLSRFENKKIYVTQRAADKLESGKQDSVEVIDKNSKQKVANGGAVVIDDVPPVPIQLIAPSDGSNTLKIVDITANHAEPDVKDIDKIIINIANNPPCSLTRQYDAAGEATGDWTCDQGHQFTETQEVLDVVVDTITGETEPRNVGVLNFTLSAGTFKEFQVIIATYYDYLGNASIPVTVSVPKLPGPIEPYDVTAVNDGENHPATTVITGMADPGALVSVTIDGQDYTATADESGRFTIEVPRQDNGTVIDVTSTLNNYISAPVPITVTGAQADDYEPTTRDINKAYGKATVAREVVDAVTVPNYPQDEEPAFVDIVAGTLLPDGKTAGIFLIPVTVTYPDGTQDAAAVKVTVGDKAIVDDDSETPPSFADRHDATGGVIDKNEGESVSEDEIKAQVKISPYTANVSLSIKDPLPTTGLNNQVTVVVSYADQSSDTVSVTVNFNPPAPDPEEPEASGDQEEGKESGDQDRPEEPGTQEEPEEGGNQNQPGGPAGHGQAEDSGSRDRPEEPGEEEQPEEPGDSQEAGEPGEQEQPSEPGEQEQTEEPGNKDTGDEAGDSADDTGKTADSDSDSEDGGVGKPSGNGVESWSLISFITTLLSALLMIIQLLIKSVRTDDSGAEFVRSTVYRYSAAIIAAAAAIYFFLNNNMNLTMELINRSTPVSVLMALFSIASLGFGLRWKKGK